MEQKPSGVQSPGVGAPLPPDYVSLAHLQELRRLKLERQRSEEEHAAELRRGNRQDETKESGEERAAVPRPGEGDRIARSLDRGRGRRGPSGRRRKDGGDPEVRSASNDAGNKAVARTGDGEGEEDGSSHGGRKLKTWKAKRQGSKRKKATAPAASGPVAAVIGEENPGNRSEAKGAEEVKPFPVDAVQDRRKEPSPQLKLSEGHGNVEVQLPSTTRDCDQFNQYGLRATMEVARTFKDLNITTPKGEVRRREAAATVGESRVPRWHRGSGVGRRGGYPSIRDSGIINHRNRRRAATGEGMVWVKKAESSSCVPADLKSGLKLAPGQRLKFEDLVNLILHIARPPFRVNHGS